MVADNLTHFGVNAWSKKCNVLTYANLVAGLYGLVFAIIAFVKMRDLSDKMTIVDWGNAIILLEISLVNII